MSFPDASFPHGRMSKNQVLYSYMASSPHLELSLILKNGIFFLTVPTTASMSLRKPLKVLLCVLNNPGNGIECAIMIPGT